MNNNRVADYLRDPARIAAGRRAFLKAAGGTALIGGTMMLTGCGGGGSDDNSGQTLSPPPATPLNEADVLNFALNLEYLEANFYSFATTGSAIDSSLQGGTGTQGAATGGRMVAFSSGSLVQKYANEIAGDERAHVDYLRRQLGMSAVAQPAIDVGTDPSGAFSSAARAAGLVADGASFDPYASEENFLLAAFIFEDVGVTAYKGAITSITTPMFIEAAAGIHAAEAYHAGLVRTLLYSKGMAAPALVSAAGAISDARDSLDGSTDDDQGIAEMNGASNIVPTDSDGIAFSRSPGQVLDIVYLTNAAATKGGFFPAGVNGRINASTAEG